MGWWSTIGHNDYGVEEGKGKLNLMVGNGSKGAGGKEDATGND